MSMTPTPTVSFREPAALSDAHHTASYAVSPQLERMFGYPRKELTGEPVELLIPHF
jgi:hypothetical protein